MMAACQIVVIQYEYGTYDYKMIVYKQIPIVTETAEYLVSYMYRQTKFLTSAV